MRSIILLFFVITFISCESKPVKSSLDLLQYGLPISVNAPEGAVVESEDLGFMKDLTIKSGDDYFVQIFSSTATSIDAKNIISGLKEEVEKEQFFSKMIQEDEHGFIYEKSLGDDKIDYDFRFVKVQGDTEFQFQTGLFGTFTLDQVKDMYESVQKK